MPDGGKSKLTTRRLLVIIEKVLDRDTSSFWCSIQGIEQTDYKGLVLSDIFYAVSGQEYPLKDFFYRRKAHLEEIEQKDKKKSERVSILSKIIKNENNKK